MPRPQRRQKFIDSKVQGALARRLVVHWVVFLTVASIVALLLQVLSNPFRPVGEHFSEVWWTHGPFLVVTIFLLPVFVMDTIKISHRFAGPIYSLRRAMRDVAAGGPLRKLQFRRNDFWRELAGDYNAMIDRLTPADEQSTSKDEPTLVQSARD